ncbi:tyrosinase family protein [Hahella ganghwensis]|uniref:tyrosinase family protein n=1 Tax=Hahella ganghwensis TaxID=286420 RepID=UPI0003624C9E|nr:tyrosinase family protein [Hahella ganghwensis]
MKTRKNVYHLQDDTLAWYSRAVEEMKTRDINDPTSWWYQGAIHGYATYPQALTFWQDATGYPPSPQTVDSGFWNRCQHGTWYFLPWHRMYLFYFEQIVAKAISDMGGPSDWTLPYWNYCEAFNTSASASEQDQALQLPPEFGSSQGPNADFQALWIKDRRNYVLKKRNVNPWPAMNETEFTNGTGEICFGGGVTGFAHSGSQTGQLESLPHNVVHTDINGAMGNPDTAALDPIFWLHHANIDRLWQVWLDQGDRHNPTINAWRNFRFKFHNAEGNPVDMVVKETETTQQLGYVYTPDFPHSTTATPRRTLPAMDVVGASPASFALTDHMSPLNLEMVPKPSRNARLKAASLAQGQKKRTVLRISNVTGKGPASPIDVFITNRDGEEGNDENFVGCIGLFGLQNASTPSVESDGSGLNFAIDVSETIDKLRQRDDWDEEKIALQLIPQSQHENDVEINVGRVSLHSEIDD